MFAMSVASLAVSMLGCVLYVSLFVSIASALISNAGIFGVELPADTVSKTVVFEFFTENNLFSYIGSLFGSGNANI